MTVALIKAAFMLGIRSQRSKMIAAGLREEDFTPICAAITDAFEKHDVAGIEADQLFKYADKDHNGLVSEAEYIAWSLDETEAAQRKVEMAKLMEPVMASVAANVQSAMTKLLTRIMKR